MFDENAKVPVYVTMHENRSLAFMVTVRAMLNQQTCLMPADLESIARAKKILKTEDVLLLPTLNHPPSVEQLKGAFLKAVSTFSVAIVIIVTGCLESAEVTMSRIYDGWDISLLKEL